MSQTLEDHGECKGPELIFEEFEKLIEPAGN